MYNNCRVKERKQSLFDNRIISSHKTQAAKEYLNEFLKKFRIENTTQNVQLLYYDNIIDCLKQTSKKYKFNRKITKTDDKLHKKIKTLIDKRENIRKKKPRVP